MNDLFLNDDFFEIVNKFFNSKKEYFNPARINSKGIKFPTSFYLSSIEEDDLKEYHNDSTFRGLQARENITEILRHFNYDLNSENITLSPTITSASLIVQKFLKEKGISNVILETPAYYATIFQLQSLGMNITLIPTYYDNAFKWDIDDLETNSCVWITNPRISLGNSQEKEFLLKLCKKVQAKDSYLIIDEATELTIPSLTLDKDFIPYMSHIIRLRSLFKPLGINGPRISLIIHHENFSNDLKKWIWTFQGGLDFYSINISQEIKQNTQEYKSLFYNTKNQAVNLHKTIKSMLIASPFLLFLIKMAIQHA